MAYTIIPKTPTQAKKLKNDDLYMIYTNLVSIGPKRKDPISISTTKTGVKITRDYIPYIKSIEKVLRVKFKPNQTSKLNKIKIAFGDGSRQPRRITNRGNIFETVVFEDLGLYIQEGMDANYQHEEILTMVVDKLNLQKAKKIDIKHYGELNQARPLTFRAGGISIGDSANYDISKIVTDITVFADNKIHNLSLKYGNIISFFNVGIARILSRKEIALGMIKNKEGKQLLDMFGIDNVRFCNVFEFYGDKSVDFNDKEEYVDVTNQINKGVLTNFLKSGIGYNYWMLHQTTKKNQMYFLDSAYLRKASTVNKVVVRYPKIGTYKKIEILISTPTYEFNINIRNTKGGVYPSHILGNYTIK